MREPKVMPECIVEWGQPTLLDNLLVAIACTACLAVALLAFAMALGFRWCPC